MDTKHSVNPAKVFREYERGKSFKANLGASGRGLYEQNRMNERFFVGDQWHGAKCGGERPLVRHNVIKRIGDYKMSVIGANPIAVNYSAEGTPNTLEMQGTVKAIRDGLIQQQSDGSILDEYGDDITPNVETNLVMSALSDYFAVTAERLKFDDVKTAVLRDSYIGGTGILYTYWDGDIKTGLYADESRKTAIKGDISCETLDVENVYFGDPNGSDVQKQPYILIVQRKRVKELRSIAEAFHSADAEYIKPDSDKGFMAGDISQNEPEDAKKATVITRLWKEKDKNGNVTVKGIQVCDGAVVRPEWDLKIRTYPLAVFTWESRKNCAYGDSEITYLIPNQIAINRMITASVWAVMMMGIPITVVNGDTVSQKITNDPGQIVTVFGSAEDVRDSIRYVNPPNFSPKFEENIQSLINNTLQQSGANDAALGDLRPDNMSAIIAVREAATQPMQILQNKFYSFVEDVARIWAEFWVMKYGKRCLKVEDDSGTWYMPFDGNRYKDSIINAKIDVGASGLWSKSQSISTLDNMLASKIITPIQYLTRLPKGVIPNLSGLINELRAAAEQQEQGGGEMGEPSVDTQGILSSLPEEYQQQLAQLPPEQAQALIESVV